MSGVATWRRGLIAAVAVVVVVLVGTAAVDAARAQPLTPSVVNTARAQPLTPDAITRALESSSSMIHPRLRVFRAVGGATSNSSPSSKRSQAAGVSETVDACRPGHVTSSNGSPGMAKVISVHSWNQCTYPVVGSYNISSLYNYAGMFEDAHTCWGISCEAYLAFYRPNDTEDGYFGPSETDPGTVHYSRHQFEAVLTGGWVWEPSVGCTGEGTSQLTCDYLGAYTVPLIARFEPGRCTQMA